MACEFKYSVCGNKYHFKEDAENCEHSHRMMRVFLWLEIDEDRLEWKTSKRVLHSYDYPFEGVRRRVTENDQSIEFSTIIVKDEEVTKADVHEAMKRLVEDARKALAEWSGALDGFEEKENLR